MFVDDETNADGKSLGQEGDDHPAHARKGEGPARQKIRGFGFFFSFGEGRAYIIKKTATKKAEMQK